MDYYDKPDINDYLEHAGVLGMHWGKRTTREKVHDISQKNKDLKTQLEKTITKSEKNKVAIAKATKKMSKHRFYLTDIGKSIQNAILHYEGWNLGRTLRKDKSLTKKIAKINNRLITNKKSIETMKTQIKSINANSITVGKDFVDSGFGR